MIALQAGQSQMFSWISKCYTFNVVNMFTRILLNTFGILFFLFIFWKKLKEDYTSTNTFSTALYILFGIGVFNILANRFLPQWWFWLDFLGASLGFALGVMRFKFRFFESLEAAVVALLPWLSLVFLGDAVLNSNLSSLIGSLVLLLIVVFYIFLDTHYKKFTWYKSGKVGFAGLITLGALFLIRIAVAVMFPFVLSFSGSIDSIISGVIAFTSFLLVFNLARQET
jgi:hypothetical protein